jgi:arsenic resistance protein ArsH
MNIQRDPAMPALSTDLLGPIDHERIEPTLRATHPPRILLLYGSLRQRSYSRLLVEEAARILDILGAETKIFDPRDLPVTDATGADHPKVQELRSLAFWSEGQVWCSPERHGAITGVFKNQIDWIPLEIGSVRPTQGRTLAVMQVSGGSQSFNAVNTLRLLGRWMRMFTIPNQSSVPKAYEQFDKAGRMRPGPLYDRVVDVMEELVRFTWLLRDRADYFVDRYSERAARELERYDADQKLEVWREEAASANAGSKPVIGD